MNLSSIISERLWLAIRATYEAGNYSGAILDSIYFISDVIRDKSGLSTDGVQLVGAAFGGANPIVKVNSLHTESDRDEQKGIHYLLMGLYTGIRNPRTHDKRPDSAVTADAIIVFADHILRLIDKARSPFDAEQTIRKVFDFHFGQSTKYADVIVEAIPQRKLLDLSIQIFHRREEAPGKNFELFAGSALKALSEDEQAIFWQVVSEELEVASSDSEFRSIIQLAQNDWQRVSRIARLRTEHRLIESVREGEFDSEKETCSNGALGTWITRIAEKAELRSEYNVACLGRLASGLQNARAYIFQYHFDKIRQIFPKPSRVWIHHLTKLLGEKDNSTLGALSFIADDFLQMEWDKDWIIALKEPYKAYEAAYEIQDEDIPF